jgi:predicted ester cyclase
LTEACRASAGEFRFTDNNRSSTTIIQTYPENVHSWRTATKSHNRRSDRVKGRRQQGHCWPVVHGFLGQDLGIVDELAAPDMLLQYSLHEPRRGREDIKAFMTDFRKAFPDLNFWGAADLIAEGDYVVGRWEGGGTHTGQAFSDFLAGSLPANTGRKMKFTGTTVLKLKDGKILEEIGLDDGVTALQQLGLIRAA